MTNDFIYRTTNTFWEFIIINLLIPIAEELIYKITIISNSNYKNNETQKPLNNKDNKVIDEYIKPHSIEEKNKKKEKT